MVIENARGRLRAAPASLLAVLAALVVAAVMVPVPALAHDTLISADPENGSTLETSPEQVALTFSADVLDVGPVVRIADADGEVVVELTPELDGPEVTAALEEPLPAGDYLLQWRVVSSDGHPIEGSEAFAVAQGPAAAETTQAGGAEGEAAEPAETPAEASPAAEDQQAQSDPAGDAENSGSLQLLFVVIGAAVLVVGVGAYLVTRRR